MRYIIKESQFVDLVLRRNIDKLPNYIRSTYKWLNPKAFGSFEEFLNRVIFSTTRDFVGAFINDVKNYETMRGIMSDFVKDIVMTEYFDEIKEYYNSNL